MIFVARMVSPLDGRRRNRGRDRRRTKMVVSIVGAVIAHSSSAFTAVD